MSNRRQQTVRGLKKRCLHLDWNKCDCHWYGKFKDVDKKDLNLWARKEQMTRAVAEIVFGEFKKAILDHKYDPRGQDITVDTASMTFGQLLDMYRKEEVGAELVDVHGEKKWRLTGDGHTSTGTVDMINVLEGEFGKDRLKPLSEMSRLLWKQRFDKLQKERDWSDRTWNRYFQLGRAIFAWAKGVDDLGIARNPFEQNNVFYASRAAESSDRERRVPVEAEQKMIEICGTGLSLAPKAHPIKLSQDIADELRRRWKKGGVSQRQLAEEFELSRATICNVVTGHTWNPETRKPSTVGREMLRRLYAAIDCGLREGEMLKVQLKHVLFGLKLTLESGVVIDAIKIMLPAQNTKGGKTTGKDEVVWAMTPRLRTALEERRFIGADGFVFGDEKGRYVASFDKSWQRLFTMAGLTVGRDVEGGFVWHDLRHEFASFLIQQGASGDDVRRLARHKDYKTTEKYLAAYETHLAQRASLMSNRRLEPKVV